MAVIFGRVNAGQSGSSDGWSSGRDCDDRGRGASGARAESDRYHLRPRRRQQRLACRRRDGDRTVTQPARFAHDQDIRERRLPAAASAAWRVHARRRTQPLCSAEKNRGRRRDGAGDDRSDPRTGRFHRVGKRAGQRRFVRDDDPERDERQTAFAQRAADCADDPLGGESRARGARYGPRRQPRHLGQHVVREPFPGERRPDSRQPAA